MATLLDFSKSTEMTHEELVKVAENAALNSDSALFRSIESAAGELVANMKKAKDMALESGRRKKQYLNYCLSPSDLHKLAFAFPSWELVCTNTVYINSPLARSVEFLVSERLYELAGVKGMAKMCYFGITLNSVILRNRHWVHVCLPFSDPSCYLEAMRAERELIPVLDKMKRHSALTGLAKRHYAGKTPRSQRCGDPVHCKVSASAGAMMLSRIPTNFRQVCLWMNAHGMSVAYIAIPHHRRMELCEDGPFPELDAQVVAKQDGFDLVFKNATDMGLSYTREAYLDLITTTVFEHAGMVYMKEQVEYEMGYAIYRVTASPSLLKVVAPTYRSWITPEYKKLYSFKVPYLKSIYLDPSDPGSYDMLYFDAEKSMTDKLFDHMMRVSDSEYKPEVSLRRLKALAGSQFQAGVVVKGKLDISHNAFEAMGWTIMAECFIEKYKTGMTIRKMLGDLSELKKLSGSGFFGTLKVAFINSCRFVSSWTFDVVGSWIRKFLGGRLTGPSLPSFVPTAGFREYNMESASPWYKVKTRDAVAEGENIGEKLANNEQPKSITFRRHPGSSIKYFSPYLPGAQEASFAFSNGLVSIEVRDPVVSDFFDGDVVRRAIADAMDEDLTMVGSELPMVPTELSYLPISDSSDVRQLVKKVIDDGGVLGDMNTSDSKGKTQFMPRQPPELKPTGYVDALPQTLKTCLNSIFPGSALSDNRYAQIETVYGPMVLNAQTVRLKMDISKIDTLRPEQIYLPKVMTHMAPNAKENFPSVMYSVIARNANTPDATAPSGIADMWANVWESMKKVFMVHNVEEILSEMEYFGPSERSVGEWVSKVSDSAKKILMSRGSLSLEEVNLEHNTLMLKGKLKPSMGNSYDSAVKPAATIQYDQSKSRVAVYSPLFYEKIRRESQLLRDNVLIMQRKSQKQISEFFSKFDLRGKKAVEIDGELFDKSQILKVLAMHWNYMAKLKVMPDYLAVLEAGTKYRDASSAKAGVSMSLPPMRGTGDPDTLDGNCDVSKVITARLLESIESQVICVAIMGDDVIFYINGDVDISGWADDIMKRFNISIKIAISPYGYFCSGYIVVFPEGNSLWVPDPVKRMLGLTSMSNTKDSPFGEQFVSLQDVASNLNDEYVQEWLVSAVKYRLRPVNPHIEDWAVRLGSRCVVTAARSEADYRSLFSSELVKL